MGVVPPWPHRRLSGQILVAGFSRSTVAPFVFYRDMKAGIVTFRFIFTAVPTGQQYWRRSAIRPAAHNAESAVSDVVRALPLALLPNPQCGECRARLFSTPRIFLVERQGVRSRALLTFQIHLSIVHCGNAGVNSCFHLSLIECPITDPAVCCHDLWFQTIGSSSGAKQILCHHDVLGSGPLVLAPALKRPFSIVSIVSMAPVKFLALKWSFASMISWLLKISMLPADPHCNFHSRTGWPVQAYVLRNVFRFENWSQHPRIL